MQSKPLVKLTLAAIFLVACLSTATVGGASHVKRADATIGGNGLIVPLYGWNNNFEQVIAAKVQHPKTSIIAIINPDSGPGAGKDSHWSDIVSRLHAVNVTVVGYVSTDYAGQPASVVESQTDSYYAWYGVDGIFFDTVSPDNYPYYKSLTIHAKNTSSSHITILNPGAAVPQTYSDAGDIIIVYENGQIPSTVTSNGIDSSKLGVLVHDVTDSGLVFSSLHQQAKYIYSAPNWSQAAPDIVAQVARMG